MPLGNFFPPNQFLKNVSTVPIWIIYLADDVICGRNAWNAVAVQYVKNNHRQSGCITSLEGRLEFLHLHFPRTAETAANSI